MRKRLHATMTARNLYHDFAAAPAERVGEPVRVLPWLKPGSERGAPAEDRNECKWPSVDGTADGSSVEGTSAATPGRPAGCPPKYSRTHQRFAIDNAPCDLLNNDRARRITRETAAASPSHGGLFFFFGRAT
jgi:hypothetical protein